MFFTLSGSFCYWPAPIKLQGNIHSREEKRDRKLKINSLLHISPNLFYFPMYLSYLLFSCVYILARFFLYFCFDKDRLLDNSKTWETWRGVLGFFCRHVFLSFFINPRYLVYIKESQGDSRGGRDVGSRSSVEGRQASTNVKRRKRERYHDGEEREGKMCEEKEEKRLKKKESLEQNLNQNIYSPLHGTALFAF